MSAARVGVLSFWHETNEYSARLAELDQWREYELLHGAEIDVAHRGTRSVIGGFLDALGEAAVPVFAAGAWPSGSTPAAVFDQMLDQLHADLEAAGGLDAIALNLHGAMVVQGVDDAEVTIVERIRSVVGDIPIAAVLDLHGNPSVALARSVEALVGYQTYPHVDMWECGDTAAGFIRRMLAGERISTSIAKLPYLTSPLAQSTDGPLGDALRWGVERADEFRVDRVSVMAGFAYQDSARAGMSVMTVGADPQGAEALATAIAERLVASYDAGDFAVERPSADRAVAQALSSSEHPVVLVDIADNIGAGSAGDGTVILSELLRQGATGAVVALADAEVARAAHEAGVGARLTTTIGGKTDALHGSPLPIDAAVVRLSDGKYVSRGSWATGQSFDMGLTAVLEVDGVTLVVTERATPPFHRETLTSAGVDPAAARILVAKAAVAWRAAYGDDARVIIEVDAPGACPIDPWILPRTTVPVTVLPATTPRTSVREGQ